MDYINEFDIHLDKEMYYPGENLTGYVLLKTIENFKLKAIKAILRGKALASWKMMIKNEKRTVKDEEVFIDDRSLIFGNEKSEQMILPRGKHVFNFTFSLPQSSLPCSFESRFCTIRYYVKVTLDIPYCSPPQGIKYFTIIGPHIDVMDSKYLKPLNANKQDKICCFCTGTYITQLKCQLERSAFCAGETIRVKAFIHNKSSSAVRLRIRLVQNFSCSIQRGVLGLNKQSSNVVLEYRGDEIMVDSRSKFDSGNSLEIPTMPPTIDSDVCRLMSISYVLKIWIESDKSNEILKVNFPIVIATSPFRIPNSPNQPVIEYENCVDFIEGGSYISPEFQLGQVYDGGLNTHEEVVLFRPVYLCVKRPPKVDAGAKDSKESKDAHAKDAKELVLHHQTKEGHLKDLHLKESKESHSSSHLRESHSRYSSQNSSKEVGSGQTAEVAAAATTAGSSGSKRPKQKKQSLKNQHSLDSAGGGPLIGRPTDHKRSGSIQQGQPFNAKLKLSSLDEQASNEFNLLENNNLADDDRLDGANQSAGQRRSSDVISSQPRSSSIGYQ